MEFDTEAQRVCYERVADMMTQLFGESAWTDPDRPSFTLTYGSASVDLFVSPWGDDRSFIDSFTWVVTGVEASAELYEYLLKENLKMRFGAFGIDDDGDVLFKYGIVGDKVDKEELRAAVMAVLQTADQYDDEIARRFGGLTAQDRASQN